MGESPGVGVSDVLHVEERRFDPVELEILWQSLIATVNEQARALQRAAFSPPCSKNVSRKSDDVLMTGIEAIAPPSQ